MSFNSFGHLLRMTSWGESHGKSVGVIIDGCPPGIELGVAQIQPWLDRRRPGQSRHMSQRREPDQVEILSGVHEGKTTGTPISLIIPNADARPTDYDGADRLFRPAHADYSYAQKYGHRDPRGGGRSSARETAARVAAGAIARLIIPQVIIDARVIELGGIELSGTETAEESGMPVVWEQALDEARRAGDSLGGIVECVATGVPAGWGAPVYSKLDAELAGALMSINAVKAVEIGGGLAAARLRGSENADQMCAAENGPTFLSNHSGGILGGISSGAPVVVRAAFKPTPSIRMLLQTVTDELEDTAISTHGRHDPCVALRGAPVVEAMVALVLADQMLLQRAQCGGS